MKSIAFAVAFFMVACSSNTTKQEETRSGSERAECSAVRAYAISKGIVKQAVHSADNLTFRSFEKEYVVQGGQWYTIKAEFYRSSEWIPYECALSCNNSEWQVAYLKVNGIDAHAGDNL